MDMKSQLRALISAFDLCQRLGKDIDGKPYRDYENQQLYGQINTIMNLQLLKEETRWGFVQMFKEIEKAFINAGKQQVPIDGAAHFKANTLLSIEAHKKNVHPEIFSRALWLVVRCYND